MNKLISVIVPIYNVEQYLETCIESIINQTYKNMEIILVDDGCTDGSARICDEYKKKDDRIKVIHKQNGVVSSARNTGLNIAKGEYVAFVDADDRLDSTIYEKLINSLDDCKSDIAICRYYFAEKGTVKICFETSLRSFVETKNYEFLFNTSEFKAKRKSVKRKHFVSSFLWRMLFKRKLLEGIYFCEKIKYSEDNLFFVNALEKNPHIKLSLVDDYLYYYNIRSDSAMHTKSKLIQNNIQYLEEFKSIINNDELIKHISFYLYFDYVLTNRKKLDIEELESIEYLNSKENYSASKKHSFGLKLKLKMFLVHHRMHIILKYA